MIVALVLVAAAGATSQGRVRLAVAGAALPGLAVVAAHQGPPGTGEAVVAVVFAGSTLAAWSGVLPAPLRVQVGTAVGSGVTIGLALAAARLASGWAPLLGPVVLAGCLTALEVAGSRTSPFGEWGSLAHSQARRRWALVVARGGPPAITSVLVLVSSAFGYAAVLGSWACAALGVAGVLGLLVLSAREALRPEPPGDARVSGLLEDDASLFAVHLPRFLDAGLAGEGLEAFEALSRSSVGQLLQRTVAAARDGSVVVVWAEGAGIVTARSYPDVLDQARAATREGGCVLVASWLVLDPGDGRMSNVTTVLDGAGDVVSSIAKAHPVPGVEAARTRSDPSTPVVVTTPLGRLGICFCFDADHPDAWRRLARDRVDVVAVPASDWPAVGTLHADMARLRARSVGATLVRPARARLTERGRHGSRRGVVVSHRGTFTHCSTGAPAGRCARRRPSAGLRRAGGGRSGDSHAPSSTRASGAPAVTGSPTPTSPRTSRPARWAGTLVSIFITSSDATS